MSESPTAFENGFLQTGGARVARSGEYQLGDMAALGLSGAMENELTPPDDLAVQRRLKELGSNAAGSGQPKATATKSRRWPVFALASAAMLLVAVMLVGPGQSPTCKALWNLSVQDCGARTSMLSARLQQQYSEADFIDVISTRPVVRAPIASVVAILDETVESYLVVEVSALPVQSEPQLGLIVETTTQAQYLAAVEQLQARAATADVAAELQRLLDIEQPQWRGAPHQSLLSLVNMH